MKYSFYIIFSEKLDRYYIGHSENIELRLQQHNSRESIYTSKASDWLLVYQEVYDDRASAHKREIEVKKKKSRKYIEWLISKP